MAYDIQPRETARVSAETSVERDRLADGLRDVVPPLDEALEAARASAPVAQALDHFLAEHYKAARELAARIDSALVHGDAAVVAYVRGDREMAEQYARSSVVFDGPVATFSPPSAAAVQARPEKVRG